MHRMTQRGFYRGSGLAEAKDAAIDRRLGVLVVAVEILVPIKGKNQRHIPFPLARDARVSWNCRASNNPPVRLSRRARSVLWRRGAVGDREPIAFRLSLEAKGKADDLEAGMTEWCTSR